MEFPRKIAALCCITIILVMMLCFNNFVGGLPGRITNPGGRSNPGGSGIASSTLVIEAEADIVGCELGFAYHDRECDADECEGDCIYADTFSDNDQCVYIQAADREICCCVPEHDEN